jgi:hypothetical protein
MSETPDSCPREDCDAAIVKTETVDVEADPRARDPRTEPVVTCAESPASRLSLVVAVPGRDDAHVGVARGWRQERRDCTGAGSRSLAAWGRQAGRNG